MKGFAAGASSVVSFSLFLASARIFEVRHLCGVIRVSLWGLGLIVPLLLCLLACVALSQNASHLQVTSIDLMANPQVLPGVLLGSAMPFLFSALTMMTLSTVR